MHEVTKATRSVYDANAEAYSQATRDFGSFPGLREALGGFAQRIPRNGMVLDLGCGAGRDLALFTSLGIRVVGADVSAEMLRMTIARCADSPAVVQSDMTCLPFRPGTFAGVWACASFVHIHSDQLRKALKELSRVLQPGGSVAISMKAGDSEGWSYGSTMSGRRWFNLMRPAVFATLLSGVGLEDVRTVECGRPEWYIATGRLVTTRVPQ